MRSLTLPVLLLAGVTALAQAAPLAAQERTDGPLTVGVSIPPQAYFVQRVGGEYVRILTLVEPGQSPHSYEPTPRQMTALAEAGLYFSIGVEFERQTLPRLGKLFPKMAIVDTRAGVPLRKMSADAHCEHEHEHDGEHDDHAGHQHEGEHHEEHGETQPTEHDHAAGEADPHIWLSPALVKIQARTICIALSSKDPAHADEYKRNLAAFEADLDKIHERLAEALKPLKGQEVFVFHPAYGYFMDEFGLRQVPVEIAGKEPTARQLAQLIDRAKAVGVHAVFVQPQFSKKTAQAVAEAIEGAVVAMDPLAADYLDNLERMAEAVKAGLKR